MQEYTHTHTHTHTDNLLNKKDINKGITLIALVVTIIVLLILAGVSISMLTGQNGILNRAVEAKEKTEVAQKDENETLNEYEKTFNKYMSNLPSTEYTSPYFPDTNKFERVEGTDLSTGLVIREKATGSEYVWVEVPKTGEVYKNAGLDISIFGEKEYNLIEKDLQDYTSEYRTKAEFKDEFFEDSSEGWFKNANEYNDAKYKMLKNVYENGGFWVGRYEAGSNKIGTKSSKEREVPITKANMYPYNYITRTQAKVLSEQVESGSSTSSLMYGLQWGLMLKYIENKKVVSKEILNKNSTSIGNYKNNSWKVDNKGVKCLKDGASHFEEGPFSKNVGEAWLLTTGASNDFALMNIYDIAGNMWEWTLEYSGMKNKSGVQVGGSWYDSGEEFYANFKNPIDLSNLYNNISFRVTIY